MKYLKYFEKESDYKDFTNGEEIEFPNVSLCKDINIIYFNPNLIIRGNKISGVFNVEDTTIPYIICPAYFSEEGMEVGFKIEEIISFKVDGIETEPIIESVPDAPEFISCRFNSIGRHTFEMEFNIEDPARIITFMQSTFVELNVSQFDTSNITTMYAMFTYCSGLTTLDGISNWDTSNVTNMQIMFASSPNLTSLDLSNWDVSNVTDMGAMFRDCTLLTSLDLSNWDTSNVTTMRNMFDGCTSLTELRMGGDVSEAITNGFMFNNITTIGNFYYNSAYDYSKIISELPSTWTAVPCTMVDGVLVPKN